MDIEDPPKLTELTQEVRLATTMTGGVSLAVWMAGVTREINLLAQASQWRRTGQNAFPDGSVLSESSRASLKLYRALIDLLDVVADVDVLTGTSAGGINAAMLALSRVKGYDLGGLRDLWLDLGALTDLIRDPTDKNTPSLLYGDERMFAVLAEQLPKLESGPFPPASDPLPPTIVYITTTLLTGETSRFTDSFGTLVQDVDRRGVFTFTENELATEDNIAKALALAARSSASFPIAFEPSFVPFQEETPQDGPVPARPAMKNYANITAPHWVADGGLLDNQPIDLLLKRIFESPAQRPVRRVLLFVVPSSGPAPDAEATPEDHVDQPLGLVDGLLKDLSAMTTQSIAADLRAIREHQDRIQARTDARLRLAELAQKLNTRLLTTSLLMDYRSREATKQAHTLTAALLRQLSTWPPESAEPTERMPKSWQDEFAVGGNAEKMCRRGITKSILRCWPEPLPVSFADFATYGPPAYEQAVGFAISICRAAYQLSEFKDDHAESEAAITEAAELVVGIRGADNEPTPMDLNALVRKVCTDPRVCRGSLEAAAARLADEYFASFTQSQEAWESLAKLLLDKSEFLRELADNASSDAGAPKGSLREQDYAAARHLRTYLDYLEHEFNPQQPTEPTLRIATNLFDLAATQRAMLPADVDVEQSLELVQVSADTRSLLAPTFQSAKQKLTGMQFHHFGAFYKRSWRANDWMWGRLDGAGWLVHVLLDPQRVRWVVQGHTGDDDWNAGEEQPGARWFIRKLEAFGAPKLPEGVDYPPRADDESNQPLTQKTLRKELAFIDDQREPVPASIPCTSLWLAQVWQQRILDDELDGLANTVINPQPGKPPDWSPPKSRTWADKVLAAQGTAKYALLDEDPVAAETFATDAGSPLMAHTITKAAATASSAVRSVRQLPGVLRPPLITLQTLTLGGYRVVSLTNGVAKSSIKIGAALLVLGVAGAIQNATWFGVGGLIFAGIGSYLIVLGTWQSSSKPGTLRRSSKAKRRSRIRRWLSKVKKWWRVSRIRRRLRKSTIWGWASRPLVPLQSVTLVGAVLSLATPVVRKWLFGTDQHSAGLVGSHVYWLGAQWWHPLIIVAAIALVVTLAGVAVGKPGRK